MKIDQFDSTGTATDSIYVDNSQLNENLDIPVPGDAIRTPKLEGKVTKVEEGYVYFTTPDGRNMRNTIQNCTVVEKLADQECNMCEDEELDEVSTELLAKYKTAAGKDASAADKNGDYARGNKRFSGIIKATKKQFANDAKKKTDEGTMSWINRSAPAVDVSYEKVLDRNPQTSHSRVVGEERMDELSIDKLRAYTDAAKSPASFKNRPLRKLAKTIQGVHGANDRIKVKTGNRSGELKPDRGTYESRLAEFVAEDLKADFGDILGKQHQEVQATKKTNIKKVRSKNPHYFIQYREPVNNLSPVKWQVRLVSDESIKQEGNSSNEKEAYQDAEAYIDSIGNSADASRNVTINFNAAFAREISPEGQPIYMTLWDGPIFVYSLEPQEGFKKTVIRTPEHSRTAGAALLPVMTISPKEANAVKLHPRNRYTLGPREELEPGVYGYTLIKHSPVEPGDRVIIKEPSITVS